MEFTKNNNQKRNSFFNVKKIFSVNILNSVINQTLKDIEIICINDGSTDNSSKILEKYYELDDRIVIINQDNKGSGFSRNKGIDISRGKFISFLDSDDMYYNNIVLESLYHKAKNNKAIICGGGMEKRSKKTNISIVSKILFDHEGFINYVSYQYDYYYQRFIYNKKFLRMNKLYFPRYSRFQDPPFFIKTMFAAKKFYVIKNITYIYRDNSGKKFNLKQVIDMFYGLKDCLILTDKFELYQLYNTTLNRLNSKFFVNGVRNYNKDKNLTKIILEILFLMFLR